MALTHRPPDGRQLGIVIDIRMFPGVAAAAVPADGERAHGSVHQCAAELAGVPRDRLSGVGTELDDAVGPVDVHDARPVCVALALLDLVEGHDDDEVADGDQAGPSITYVTRRAPLSMSTTWTCSPSIRSAASMRDLSIVIEPT
jgi:hypothetical protein